jgi:hypothetical protein
LINVSVPTQRQRASAVQAGFGLLDRQLIGRLTWQYRRVSGGSMLLIARLKPGFSLVLVVGASRLPFCGMRRTGTRS